jgi:predicted Fe-Mo cluster-binding NifX family protein
MPEPTPLPKTSAPAARALAEVGITVLDDLRDRDVDALLEIHGVGPKAIRILKAALAERSATSPD